MADASSIREQLDALYQLAQLDGETRKLEQEMKEIPAKLADLDRDVERVEQLVSREQQQLADAEDVKRRHEQEMSGHGEMLARSKAKAAASRNTREVEAMQRELDTIRRMGQEREEEMLKLMQMIDELGKRIVEHQGDLEKLRAMVGSETAAADARLGQLRAETERSAAGRAELVAKIDRQIYRRYDSIRGRRGDGLGEVKDGACQGCNMGLPPQLYNHLQRLSSIEQCPFCQRVLFWRPAQG